MKELRVWSEYVPDLCSVRVYCDGSEDPMSVHIEGHKIVAKIGPQSKIAIQVPLDYPSEKIMFGEVSKTDEFQSVSVRLPSPIRSDFLDSISHSLSEDWSNLCDNNLVCRKCDHSLEEISDIRSITPCLLPSATWGFEDMRVCEECGPLVAGNCHGTTKSKKVKSVKFFVSEFDLFIPKSVEGESVYCPSCVVEIASQVSPGELRALDDNAENKYIKIEKIRLGGPIFSTFTESSIFFAKTVLNQGHLKLRLRLAESDESLFVNCLTGSRDVIVGIDGKYSWCTRVTFSTSVRKPEQYKEIVLEDETIWRAIREELDLFSLPSCLSLSKQWKTGLVRLPPVLVEL